ncbi:hypothetical protein llap_11580 [Limosa lapponica baueri]|uniref:Tyrosine-protein phosphatase domain-containing protein n=1 Tax=Limosa lapponica baueri TaxID=1758121 RepID=A0A2I0TWD9_LIMLA|nr:hypothetical protein llap_11580 [Limosa lapponica baueri]
MPQELENFQPYPVEILPAKLYMGNFKQACDQQIQKDLKIKTQVNISEQHATLFPEGGKYLHVSVPDSLEADLFSTFSNICHFIDAQLDHGAVLVFSSLGISRSSTVTIAYLMHFCQFSLKDNHKLYKQKLEELTKLQDGISSSITRQKKRLKELSLSLKKCKTQVDPEQKVSIQETQNLIKERQNVFFEMEAYLPKKNGLYLSLVLGNVNVTLLSKQAKFAYKDEYEKFKLYLTIILLIVSFSCRFLLNSRVTDAVFNFLLVWYYCTLTIRESILINNGSKIKGWWVFHHYVSTFLSGVMLTWPDGLMYQMFRNQFLSFSMYQSFVQFLQYYYQSGCLYRLRALGERHNMDLTVGYTAYPRGLL